MRCINLLVNKIRGLGLTENSGKRPEVEELYTIKGKKIFRKGALFLSFTNRIEICVVLDNALVVLLSNDESLQEQNIICYSMDKELKWQVPKAHKLHYTNIYSGLYIRDKELYAYCTNGVEYHLDKETGEVLDSQLIR